MNTIYIYSKKDVPNSWAEPCPTHCEFSFLAGRGRARSAFGEAPPTMSRNKESFLVTCSKPTKCSTFGKLLGSWQLALSAPCKYTRERRQASIRLRGFSGVLLCLLLSAEWQHWSASVRSSGCGRPVGSPPRAINQEPENSGHGGLGERAHRELHHLEISRVMLSFF